MSREEAGRRPSNSIPKWGGGFLPPYQLSQKSRSDQMAPTRWLLSGPEGGAGAAAEQEPVGPSDMCVPVCAHVELVVVCGLNVCASACVRVTMWVLFVSGVPV